MKWEESQQQQSTKVMVCGNWEMWIHDTWVLLFNNTMLGCLDGQGDNEQEAFRDFLAEIDKYRGKLDRVESEIRQILAENNNEEEVKNG